MRVEAKKKSFLKETLTLIGSVVEEKERKSTMLFIFLHFIVQTMAKLFPLSSSFYVTGASLLAK